MDFAWSDGDLERYQNIERFARTRLPRPSETEFPRENWQRCGEFGLHGLCLPERYGGMGLDALRTAHAVEAFGCGSADMGLVFASCAHLFAAVMPLYEFGSDGLKARYLPALARGSAIAANAITEAEAGSDIHALKTTARREGNFYILDGVKSYATNASVADYFLVYAVTNPKHGYFGITGFWVPRELPGVQCGAPFRKTGLSTAPTASVYFAGVRVPEELRVGGEGQGAVMFANSMQWERSCLFAAYIGAMDRYLNLCIKHAQSRHQFGKPLSAFQAISHRIVNMKMRLESARLLLYRACWLHDRSETAATEIAMAKIAISEAAIQNGLDTIQIFGGAGVMSETGIDCALLDALPAAIFSGTSEIQRNLIAKELGL